MLLLLIIISQDFWACIVLVHDDEWGIIQP